MKSIRKNPLRKRIYRELRDDWRKYLVVSLFLILTIGFVSGMFVANESMTKSITKSYNDYNLEDGHFELKTKITEDMKAKIEAGDKTDATIYQNFYKNEDEDYDNDGKANGKIRIYSYNEDINKACILEGRIPKTSDEIAIDRMHADNADIKVDDTITLGDVKYRVVGLIAYVNYSTLYEKNTDFMFDALNFDIGMVTEKGFKQLTSQEHYSYSWIYKNKPVDKIEEKTMSEDFLKELITRSTVAGIQIEDYLPTYENQAVQFAPDDIGGDKAMGGVLLYILTGVIGFIFAITIANTITREASQIGTLRASGYTKRELIIHYLATPVVVTIVSAIIGNVLGYTLFKNIVVKMYYNSYSLPTYKTLWNGSAFIKTTLIPLIIMVVVNLAIIVRMMQYSPLRFLRHDFKNTRRKKAMRLPSWKFFSRFRLRIMFQNISNYLILFVGILLVAVMLSMAVGMPDTLKYYQNNASNLMFAKYQYVLKNYEINGKIVSTNVATAETFSMKSLLHKSENLEEEITVYGIHKESDYVKIKNLCQTGTNEVYISKSYQKKYGLKTGDIIELDEKYEHTNYKLKIKGIYTECQTLAVFMSEAQFNQYFDQKKESFNGFLSDVKIDDLDTNNIATVITKHDITKMCDQLDHSMGSYMVYFQYLCILLSAVLMYLLTKIIIEKNENAISMTKILGYSNGEIARLYMVSTTIIVVIADFISVILGNRLMAIAWKVMMFSYSGWFDFVVTTTGYIKIFGFILLGYFIVMIFDFKRIKKIPMEDALKNVE